MRWAAVPGWDDPAHLYKVFLISERPLHLLGRLLVRRQLRRRHLRLPLLLARSVGAGQGDRRPRRRRRPRRCSTCTSGTCGRSTTRWPSWLFVGDDGRLPRPRPGPVRAGARAHAGRHGAAGSRPSAAGRRARWPSASSPIPWRSSSAASSCWPTLLARPGTRRRYLVFFAAVAPFARAARSRGDRLRRARQLPQRDVTADAVPRLRPRRRGPGRRERRPPSPAVRHPVRHVRLRVRGRRSSRRAVRSATTSAASSSSSALPLLVPASPLTAAAAVPLRRSGGHPHRALRLLQISSPYSHFTKPEERPQTRATYFAPALPAARQLYDPDYRLHVVALRRHWESYYFPRAGYRHHARLVPAGRRDPQRALLRTYDAAAYVAWLRSMGVKYIFVPQALRRSLEPASRPHPARSPAFAEVEETGAGPSTSCWSRDPIVVGRDGGTAHVRRFGHQRPRHSRSTRPARYLVKVSWSPYWKLEGGQGRSRAGPADCHPVAGARRRHVTLRFQVTPDAVVDQVLAAAGPLVQPSGRASLRGIQSPT